MSSLRRRVAGQRTAASVSDTNGDTVTQPAVQAEQLAGLVQSRGWTAVGAESLTSGAIASQLGEAPNASSWFLGAVVAYSPRAKFDVLCVPPGPVVRLTTACARANAVAARFGVDLSLAATGVGCPRPESGISAGTVWFAVRHPGRTRSYLRHLSGPTDSVIGQTVSEALELLIAACHSPDRFPGDHAAVSGATRVDVHGPRPTESPVAGDLPITPTWSG
ncbi:CinA family protein [Pedococcus bigeumensis]|nr:CinA family protein [Pedococcus bigeumensis]